MNEWAARTAIQTLIENNKATLVTGLTHQGVARKIGQITCTALTPAIGYYFVAIECLTPKEVAMDQANASSAAEVNVVEYPMVVYVQEAPFPIDGESHAFSTMVQHFTKLCDRIVKLIRETAWIPAIGATPRFRLKVERGNLRLVTKNNKLVWGVEYEQGPEYGVLTSEITFTLVDECDDPALLYA